MDDLPLNALRVLAAVYAEGGVRAAARRLGVAHSAVSRQLAEAERRLGIEVVRHAPEGRGRELRFTREGEALAKAVAASLREISAAVAGLRGRDSPQTVTLAAPPVFARRWLLPRLPVLEAAHPSLRLAVVAVRPGAGPAGGEPDLEICMGRGPWRGIRAEPLLDELAYPVMSSEYWERSGRPSRPGDLVGLRLLHARDSEASWDRWKQAFGPSELDVRRGARLASTDLLYHAAAQGHGVALGRHRLIRDDVAAGRLVRPIPILQLELGYEYWIAAAPGRPAPPGAAVVLAWLRQQAGRG